MKTHANDLLLSIRNLKEYKSGLKLSQAIHKNAELVGRKNMDTLQRWHQIGSVVENIKKKIGKSYGRGLVNILAKEYGHDGADLHRAAKFFRLSPDYRKFQSTHPEISDVRTAIERVKGTQKEKQNGQDRVTKCPTAKAVAKQLETIERRFHKILEDFFVLLSEEQDTSEVHQGLMRIRDTLEKALRIPPSEIGSTASQVNTLRPKQDNGDIEVVPYRECSTVATKITGPLALAAIEDIAEIVVEVAKTEGPIHKEDLMERVQTITKQPRSGKRIRERMNAAIELAAWERGWVTESEGFIWADPEKRPRRIRVRRNPKDRNLKHICDEELRLAAERILSQNDTADPGTTARAALNLLGFVKPRKADCDRVMGLLTIGQNAMS